MNTAISQIKISSVVRDGNRVHGYAIEPDSKIAIKFAATVDLDRFIPDAILVVSGLFRLASEPATVGLLVRGIVAEVFIPTACDEPDEESEPDFDIPDERFVGVGVGVASPLAIREATPTRSVSQRREDCAQRNLSDVPAPTPARKKCAAKSSKSDTKKPSRGKKSASVDIAV